MCILRRAIEKISMRFHVSRFAEDTCVPRTLDVTRLCFVGRTNSFLAFHSTASCHPFGSKNRQVSDEWLEIIEDDGYYFVYHSSTVLPAL